MAQLPSVEEQDWIVEGLAGLIARRGSASLLTGHVVEPSERCFPERFSPDEHGVHNLLGRFMFFAALDHLRPRVQVFDEAGEEAAEGDDDGYHVDASVAAWFMGLRNDRCVFGVRRQYISSPDALVGLLSHEIAHAWRVNNKLATEDLEEEEPLTDLTAVFLGFGILVTNNAFRYRTTGSVHGHTTTLKWSHDMIGYLTAAQFSFALAVQAVARGLSSSDRARIARQLETAQAASFKLAVRHLDANRPGLLARLGLPPDAIGAPLDDEPLPAIPSQSGSAADALLAAQASAARASDEEPRPPRVGKTVFRNRRVPSRAAMVFGAIPSLAICLLMGAALANALRSDWAYLISLAVFWFLATQFASGSKPVCSDPECRTLLPPEALHCPGCGGVIRGVINNADDRLAAEEGLEEAALGSPLDAQAATPARGSRWSAPFRLPRWSRFAPLVAIVFGLVMARNPAWQRRLNQLFGPASDDVAELLAHEISRQPGLAGTVTRHGSEITLADGKVHLTVSEPSVWEPKPHVLHFDVRTELTGIPSGALVASVVGRGKTDDDAREQWVREFVQGALPPLLSRLKDSPVPGVEPFSGTETSGVPGFRGYAGAVLERRQAFAESPTESGFFLSPGTLPTDGRAHLVRAVAEFDGENWVRTLELDGAPTEVTNQPLSWPHNTGLVTVVRYAVFGEPDLLTHADARERALARLERRESWLFPADECPADVMPHSMPDLASSEEACRGGRLLDCVEECAQGSASACYGGAQEIFSSASPATPAQPALKDVPMSTALFLRACRLGYASACTNAAAVPAHVSPTSYDPCALRTFDWTCERARDPWACAMFGNALAFGLGIPVDLPLARAALGKACQLDETDPACRRARGLLKRLDSGADGGSGSGVSGDPRPVP